MDTFDKAVEGVTQVTELVVAVDGQALGQVTFTLGDVFHGPGHGVQRLQQHADQQAEQGDDDRHGHQGGDHRRGAELAEHRIGLVLVHRQADVPVGRRQPLDRREGQQAGVAIGLDFGQLTRQSRRAPREQVRQRFHHQRLVRVDQDLALVVDQEGVAHAAEVQRIDDLHQAFERQVATDHTDAAGHLAEDADHRLVGGQVDVGFGEYRAAGSHAVLVPGTGARVVALGHLGVGTHAEAAIDLAQVNGQEARNQRLLAHQRLGIGRFLGDVLRQVFHQRDPPLQQVANVGGGRFAHFGQVVFQADAGGIALQVVVVEGEQGEGEHHDQRRCQKNFVAETKTSVHGVVSSLDFYRDVRMVSAMDR
ncbi:hypothetical protein D3C77_285070 [compost metagenome]